MSAVNRITKYNLEERTRELDKKQTSLRDIADILTKESGHKISKDSVYSFLKSDIKYTAEIVEKKTQLKAIVAEAEISTIEDRLFFITKMKDLVETTENEKIKVMASVEGTKMLESLDKRIGAVSPDSNITNINIQQNNLTIKEKIQRYRDAGLFNAH